MDQLSGLERMRAILESQMSKGDEKPKFITLGDGPDRRVVPLGADGKLHGNPPPHIAQKIHDGTKDPEKKAAWAGKLGGGASGPADMSDDELSSALDTHVAGLRKKHEAEAAELKRKLEAAPAGTARNVASGELLRAHGRHEAEVADAYENHPHQKELQRRQEAESVRQRAEYAAERQKEHEARRTKSQELEQSVPGAVRDYARTLADENIRDMEDGREHSLPADERDRLLTNEYHAALQHGAKLHAAIEQKDLRTLVERLHSGNPNSRKLFEKLTGVSLGRTNASAEQALKSFAGEDAVQKLSDAHTAEAAERDASRAKRAHDGMVSRLSGSKVRHEGEVMSRKDFIDKLVDKSGYRKMDMRKVGATHRMSLGGPDGMSYEFKLKDEMDYIKHRLASAPPVEAEKEAAVKPGEVDPADLFRTPAQREAARQGAAESHTYGARNRPVGFATVPKGHTSVDAHPDFRHGTVTYPRALTDKEAYDFELTKIPSAAERNAFIEKSAAEMPYAKEYLEEYDEDPSQVEPVVGEMIAQSKMHMPDRKEVTKQVMERIRAAHPAEDLTKLSFADLYSRRYAAEDRNETLDGSHPIVQEFQRRAREDEAQKKAKEGREAARQAELSKDPLKQQIVNTGGANVFSHGKHGAKVSVAVTRHMGQRDEQAEKRYGVQVTTREGIRTHAEETHPEPMTLEDAQDAAHRIALSGELPGRAKAQPDAKPAEAKTPNDMWSNVRGSGAVVTPAPSRVDAPLEDLVADYKARGFEPSTAYGQLVKDKNFNPGIDMSHLVKMWPKVDAKALGTQKVSGGVGRPTHRIHESHLSTGPREVEITGHTPQSVQWIQYGSNGRFMTGGTPKHLVTKVEKL